MNYFSTKPFFKRLNLDKERKEIQHQCFKVMQLEEFKRDNFVCHYGERGDKFYVVLKGSVRIVTPVKMEMECSKLELLRHFC